MYSSNKESPAQFENLIKPRVYVRRITRSITRSTMYKKAPLLAVTGVREISSEACGFSTIKIHFSDYQKSLISRINEVYVFFNKIWLAYSHILLKKNINFIYNHLFCCNYTCYCVSKVSVTSAPPYVTSVSHQSRSSMYIRGLIPEFGKAVPIGYSRCSTIKI